MLKDRLTIGFQKPLCLQDTYLKGKYTESMKKKYG